MRSALVVLGNGALGRDGVYRISGSCLRLVAEAELLAAALAPDVALFTGWSPTGGPSEAEQMRDAWTGMGAGPAVELVVEPSARNTAQNAARTLPLLLERGIERATVVCAPLHLLRTRFFFERLYEGTGIETSFHAARFLPTPRALAWELAALPVRRAQLRAARAELARRLA
jgi:uncharacterized SAM-binding protein YcdF (DUF218 family)